MAKKKNTPKKHKFKHVDPAQSMETANRVMATSQSGGAGARPVFTPAAVGARDFSYVGKDVRRIGIMAAALVAIELAFYYLLVFTSAGPAIYRVVGV